MAIGEFLIFYQNTEIVPRVYQLSTDNKVEVLSDVLDRFINESYYLLSFDCYDTDRGDRAILVVNAGCHDEDYEDDGSEHIRYLVSKNVYRKVLFDRAIPTVMVYAYESVEDLIEGASCTPLQIHVLSKKVDKLDAKLDRILAHISGEW
jgi:hypothetical protein